MLIDEIQSLKFWQQRLDSLGQFIPVELFQILQVVESGRANAGFLPIRKPAFIFAFKQGKQCLLQIPALLICRLP